MYDIGPLAATRAPFETRAHDVCKIGSSPEMDDEDFQRWPPAFQSHEQRVKVNEKLSRRAMYHAQHVDKQKKNV